MRDVYTIRFDCPFGGTFKPHELEHDIRVLCSDPVDERHRRLFGLSNDAYTQSRSDNYWSNHSRRSFVKSVELTANVISTAHQYGEMLPFGVTGDVTETVI
jgi:hypothetical protein